jgi:hypothetical protein
MQLSKLLQAADHPYLFGKGGRKANNARTGMQVSFNLFSMSVLRIRDSDYFFFLDPGSYCMKLSNMNSILIK